MMSRIYLTFALVSYVLLQRCYSSTALIPSALIIRRTSSTLSPLWSVVVNRDQEEGSSSRIDLCDPETIAFRVFENDQRPVILFDGVCNLCNTAVNLALDWDPTGKLRFAALQSNVGRGLLQANGRDANDISSIVLVTNEAAYTKSDAILKISEELTPLGRLLPIKPAARLGQFIIPKFFRDVIYDGVANNRYSFLGRRDTCRFDAEGEFEDRFVDDKIALRLL